MSFRVEGKKIIEKVVEEEEFDEKLARRRINLIDTRIARLQTEIARLTARVTESQAERDELAALLDQIKGSP